MVGCLLYSIDFIVLIVIIIFILMGMSIFWRFIRIGFFLCGIVFIFILMSEFLWSWLGMIYLCFYFGIGIIKMSYIFYLMWFLGCMLIILCFMWILLIKFFCCIIWIVIFVLLFWGELWSINLFWYVYCKIFLWCVCRMFILCGCNWC